jgi:hypothetical protein
MDGRTILRAIAVLALVSLGIAVGVGVYNAGVTAGFAEAARQAATSGGTVPTYPWAYGAPYVHGPFGYGFGFGGILFGLLAVLLVIGLVRAAFGGRRWGGPGPRGWGERHDRIEAWHRELHRRDDGEGAQRSASV